MSSSGVGAIVNVAAIAAVGLLIGCGTGLSTPMDRHQAAVRDFQRLTDEDAGRPGPAADPACGGLCQNAVAACEASHEVCEDVRDPNCPTARQGCAWVITQLPRRCGSCGLTPP